MSNSSDKKWFVRRGEKQFGPFTKNQVRDLAKSSRIKPTDEIWKDGMEGWVQLSKFRNIFPEQIADKNNKIQSKLLSSTMIPKATKSDSIEVEFLTEIERLKLEISSLKELVLNKEILQGVDNLEYVQGEISIQDNVKGDSGNSELINTLDDDRQDLVVSSLTTKEDEANTTKGCLGCLGFIVAFLVFGLFLNPDKGSRPSSEHDKLIGTWVREYTDSVNGKTYKEILNIKEGSRGYIASPESGNEKTLYSDGTFLQDVFIFDIVKKNWGKWYLDGDTLTLSEGIKWYTKSDINKGFPDFVNAYKKQK
jgi:hypothetical protein